MFIWSLQANADVLPIKSVSASSHLTDGSDVYKEKCVTIGASIEAMG